MGQNKAVAAGGRLSSNKGLGALVGDLLDNPVVAGQLVLLLKEVLQEVLLVLWVGRVVWLDTYPPE